MMKLEEEKMIRERLQELDIKITELARYLQLSRPTMYKFIEAYDNGDKKVIHKNVLEVFDYISTHELLDKGNVIGFILSMFNNLESNETEEQKSFLQEVKNYMSQHPDSEKLRFIQSCLDNSYFDLVIHYLMEISPLLEKEKLTDKEKKLLKAYREITRFYTK